jgi:hypothetical protein
MGGSMGNHFLLLESIESSSSGMAAPRRTPQRGLQAVLVLLSLLAVQDLRVASGAEAVSSTIIATAGAATLANGNGDVSPTGARRLKSCPRAFAVAWASPWSRRAAGVLRMTAAWRHARRPLCR